MPSTHWFVAPHQPHDTWSIQSEHSLYLAQKLSRHLEKTNEFKQLPSNGPAESPRTHFLSTAHQTHELSTRHVLQESLFTQFGLYIPSFDSFKEFNYNINDINNI